jgi:SpoIID/LytB domain protein
VPAPGPQLVAEAQRMVQAVAARSYALASRKTGGSFDVFADTRSQVYGGILSEDPRTTEAVNATKGQIVLFDGKVAWTFFSSSSGGKTASIQDVWPDSDPLPYLVSVDDPYDTISPYHDWGPVAFTAAELKAKLGARFPAGVTGADQRIVAKIHREHRRTRTQVTLADAATPGPRSAIRLSYARAIGGTILGDPEHSSQLNTRGLLPFRCQPLPMIARSLFEARPIGGARLDTASLRP